MVLSAEGVAGRVSALTRMAGKHGAGIYIHIGAICGMYSIKAARIGRIRSVTLTTRKPPH